MKIATLQRVLLHPCIVAFFFSLCRDTAHSTSPCGGTVGSLWGFHEEVGYYPHREKITRVSASIRAIFPKNSPETGTISVTNYRCHCEENGEINVVRTRRLLPLSDPAMTSVFEVPLQETQFSQELTPPLGGMYCSSFGRRLASRSASRRTHFCGQKPAPTLDQL